MAAMNDQNLNPLDWLYRALSLFPLHYIRLSHTSGMIDAKIGM